MAGRAAPIRRILLATMALGLGVLPGQALDRLDFTVSGDEKALVAAVRAASGLLAAQKAKKVDPLDLFAGARAEYGRLLSALYATGHYGAVIHVRLDGREAADIAALDAPSVVHVIAVTVDPGPVFAFGQIGVGPLAPRTVLPTGFDIGKVAESGVVKAAVQAGVDGWRGRGNAKAAVSAQSVVADHARSVLDAAVTIAPGPVLRFGAVTVQGAVRMREDRVREIAGLPVGERFDPVAEDRATERLRRTGVFSSVALREAAGITPPDLLGMTADVVEAKTRRYSFGAEVASNDGLLLTGSWLHRNLLGGGERLEITGQVANIASRTSGIDYALGVTLDRPATPGPDTTLNLGLNIAHKDEADYRADIFGASLGFTHYFSGELTAHAALGTDYSQGHDTAGAFQYQSLDLPLGVTWDRRDSKTDATRLFYLDATAKPFIGFGSTDNGLRLSFDARGYKSAGPVVFAARLQGGAVLGASVLGTPREDLFYSGGGGTVRGQPYQSLGVTVDDGGIPVTVGGTTFLGTSLEARVKVSERIGVVGFADFGLVGLGGVSPAHSDWQAGVGLGLRYQTGVGPIRLDVALPVHGTGRGVQIYVGLGQAF